MNKRVEKVLHEMRRQRLGELVICDSQSIWYLTGISVGAGERMLVYLLKEDGEQILFANRLFNVPETPFETVWFDDTDDSVGLLVRYIDEDKTCGIDKDWPARFLIPLLEKIPHLKVKLGSDCVDNVRAVKDEVEIEFMKEASRINDIVIEKARDYIREGITEKEVARYIDQLYLDMGCEGNSFPSIVSFGANAADPHHMPDDTVVKSGDVVLIDIGCQKNRYCSDMTRTFFFRETSEKQKQVHDIVRRANEYAESIIKPGVRLCDIDKAARDIISAEGYGEYFTHRLGHFIGQSDHEKGDVSSANHNTVEPGMIFSIEPGIYLKGEFGVRIEDLVLVTEEGCEVLNKVDKKYRIL